jgi:hypothetical protein
LLRLYGRGGPGCRFRPDGRAGAQLHRGRAEAEDPAGAEPGLELRPGCEDSGLDAGLVGELYLGREGDQRRRVVTDNTFISQLGLRVTARAGPPLPSGHRGDLVDRSYQGVL